MPYLAQKSTGTVITKKEELIFEETMEHQKAVAKRDHRHIREGGILEQLRDDACTVSVRKEMQHQYFGFPIPHAFGNPPANDLNRRMHKNALDGRIE